MFDQATAGRLSAPSPHGAQIASSVSMQDDLTLRTPWRRLAAKPDSAGLLSQRLGSGCDIGSHCVLKGPTTLGSKNRIYSFASIGDDPQDKKYADEPTRLTIGDRNTIREFCTISRGTIQDTGHTILGDDNWIMAYVHIAHDCVIGNKTIMANNVTLAGHVHVDDWVIFGGFSGAHQFTKIGAHAFLGMYSGVNRDVPAYTMVSGQPAVPESTSAQCVRNASWKCASPVLR